MNEYKDIDKLLKANDQNKKKKKRIFWKIFFPLLVILGVVAGTAIPLVMCSNKGGGDQNSKNIKIILTDDINDYSNEKGQNNISIAYNETKILKIKSVLYNDTDITYEAQVDCSFSVSEDVVSFEPMDKMYSFTNNNNLSYDVNGVFKINIKEKNLGIDTSFNFNILCQKNNDVNDKLIITLNDGDTDITGETITNNFFGLKDYTIKNVSYNGSDITSTATTNFTLNQDGSYSNFLGGQNGNFAIQNHNISGLDDIITIRLHISENSLSLNKTIDYKITVKSLPNEELKPKIYIGDPDSGGVEATPGDFNINYGEAKTYVIKEWLYGNYTLDDKIIDPQADYNFEGNAQLTFSKGNTGPYRDFIVENKNTTTMPVNASLNIVISKIPFYGITNKSYRMDFNGLPNDQDVISVSYMIDGVPYSSHKNVSLDYNATSQITIQDLLINGEAINDSDWQVQWEVSDSDILSLENGSNKTCSIRNKNTKKEDVTCSLIPKITCESKGVISEPLDKVVNIKAVKINVWDWFIPYAIPLDNTATFAVGEYDEEYFNNHKMNLNESSTLTIEKNNFVQYDGGYVSVIYFNLWDKVNDRWFFPWDFTSTKWISGKSTTGYIENPLLPNYRNSALGKGNVYISSKVSSLDNEGFKPYTVATVNFETWFSNTAPNFENLPDVFKYDGITPGTEAIFDVMIIPSNLLDN